MEMSVLFFLHSNYFLIIDSIPFITQFFSSTGRPLLECNDIEPSVFFVPDTHFFMWPTFELGHRVSLEDITVPGVEDSVSLVTVSHSPRIFLVENLISSAESDQLIEYMSTKSSEEDGLDVSLIGDGVISLQRTSSNGWDSESTVLLFTFPID
jgi:hypothetical protein